ncbi:MAG TPA: LytTR family DNA-binding domain-containing protein [Chitinophagaceae bacterium]|jgi:two-component system LytT family response regulator|nr:LytTR family DNA-binding domain-containing protein [Chitinophagaceae bacterium]HRG91440.1 LytTR family DNA-binding domain-containing protein [Chitinophagaceae bacterium]
MSAITTSNHRLSLLTSTGTFYFCPEEIIRLKACSNYTTIFFAGNKKMLSAKVLKDFDTLLSPYGFVRTHRTHLVNRQHVLCITPDGQIIMKDASVASISRRMKSRVIKTFNNAA